MKVHIGKEIEKKVRENGLSVAEFARRINTVPKNVYNIFDRESIKTDQLTQIGEILNFNFFQYYAEPPEHITMAAEAIQQYKMNVESISVNVLLDGTTKTLDRWINRMKAINKMLNQGV